MDTTQEVRVLT